MTCLEGSARYLEYDWVAGPGDFIQEVPVPVNPQRYI